MKQPLEPNPIQNEASPSQELAFQLVQAHTDYWRAQMSGQLPVLELPTRRERSALGATATAADQVDAYSLRLPQALCDRLQTIAQSENATLFMTLLAAFQTLMYRYTGQTDMLVGAAECATENNLGTTGQPDYPLPLRLSLTDEATFLSLLSQVRDVTLAAQTHQAAPYSEIIEALKQGYGSERSSLFQTQFLMSSDSPTVSDNQANRHEIQQLAQPLPRSELSLHICQSLGESLVNETSSTKNGGSNLVCHFLYQASLFDSATIARMASHFQTLLEGIVASPEQTLSSLPLLSPAERHQQLTEWNSGSEADQDLANHSMDDSCLHELFEQQVEIAPEAIAVVFENERLSYQTLNQRANQLAHYLRSLGVGPEVPVGLCVERSTSVVIAILAILKAGGAYVPLDPTTPKERLNFILADSQMSVLITETSQASAISDKSSEQASTNNLQTLQRVNLESDWDLISQMPQENPACNTTPQNLAYIIYTSGTTGRPKGVLSQHFNVTRLFSKTEHWFQFSEQDVWTLFHSYAFDFSVWEIWGALLYGGRLVVVPYATSRWPKAFYQLLESEQVTVLNQTPSAFRQVMRAEEMMENTQPLALRWVIFGGEALDLQCLRPWFERHGDQQPQLVNMYGITETTVHVTYRPIALADLSSKGSVIGRPIPDLQLYILDSQQQLLPIGVVGELYVGGAGLARGYLNRPELTSEKFIPSPFSRSSQPSSQERLYRTGDLACYLPDGDMEYLGRIDHQVKIRGFRIELGEIEARLSQLPQVGAATVMVREDIADDKRLVAYIVPRAGKSLLARELRSEIKERLKESLPDYMVPSAYVMLEALPLTSNGKIDRQALPVPPVDQPVLSTEFSEPRTALERQLSQTWCKFLNLERVGIFDSFFELGGHSLLATQLVSQVEAAFQQSLSLAEFFQAHTIAAQAKLLERIKQDAEQPPRWSSLVPMQAVSEHEQTRHEQTDTESPLPALFCVHGGGGSVLMYQALARHLSDCFRLYGLQSSYLNNPEKLLTTVEEMAELYLDELRSVQSEGPYLIGGYCGGAPIALEMAQRLRAAGETVALLALFDPVSIQTEHAPIRRFAMGESVRSLLSRLNQHGLKFVVQDHWLKVNAWVYQRRQRPLTLEMRSVKVQAANVRAMRAYVAQASYGGPVAIYIPKEGINPKGSMSEGWATLLTGDVSVHRVAGKHHFDESTEGSFFHEPAVRTLADRLKASATEALK